MTAPLVYQNSRDLRPDWVFGLPVAAPKVTSLVGLLGPRPGELWERVAEGKKR
jgi:hypothetical protein